MLDLLTTDGFWWTSNLRIGVNLSTTEKGLTMAVLHTPQFGYKLAAVALDLASFLLAAVALFALFAAVSPALGW